MGGIIISNLTIYERAKEEAKYIIANKATVRQTAVATNVSKSTVHKDVTEVLNLYHDPLKAECAKVLEANKNERHLRGGEATKQIYLQLRYTKWGVFL